jgi:hypothetical protein
LAFIAAVAAAAFALSVSAAAAAEAEEVEVTLALEDIVLLGLLGSLVVCVLCGGLIIWLPGVVGLSIFWRLY